MKSSLVLLPLLAIGSAIAANSTGTATAPPHSGLHRFLIESTAGAGTLATLESANRSGTSAADASVGAHWLRSYASADKTRIYSLYEAPSEAAVRKAATLDRLPVEKLAEVPVDLDSGTMARPADLPAGSHRFLIERTFPAGALDGLDDATRMKVNSANADHGVQWVTSYANDGKTKTYCIYNGPSEAAIRAAAKANGLPVDSVTEVPVTVAPRH